MTSILLNRLLVFFIFNIVFANFVTQSKEQENCISKDVCEDLSSLFPSLTTDTLINCTDCILLNYERILGISVLSMGHRGEYDRNIMMSSLSEACPAYSILNMPIREDVCGLIKDQFKIVSVKSHFTQAAIDQADYFNRILGPQSTLNSRQQPFTTSGLFNLWWPLNESKVYVASPPGYTRTPSAKTIVSPQLRQLIISDKLILELQDAKKNANYILRLLERNTIKMIIYIEKPNLNTFERGSDMYKCIEDSFGTSSSGESDEDESLNSIKDSRSIIHIGSMARIEISPEYFLIKESIIELSYPLNLTTHYADCGIDKVRIVISLCYEWDADKCFAVFPISLSIIDMTATQLTKVDSISDYSNDSEDSFNTTTTTNNNNNLVSTSHPFINKIPNRNYFGYSLSFLLKNASSFVEIGVNKGEFSEIMQTTYSQFTRYILVDPWGEYGSIYRSFRPSDRARFDRLYYNRRDGNGDNSRWLDMNNIGAERDPARQIKESFSTRMEETIARLSSINRNISVIIRATSIDASFLIEDNSIDVVYIDARHDYLSVTEDLRAWYPKVKCGGILAGHDYATAFQFNTIFTVKPAVDDFAFSLGLVLYQTQDEVLPSWFFYKTNC